MSMNSLPSKEHSFKFEDLKVGGPYKSLTGKFTYKRPDIKTATEIGKLQARLNEGLPVDEDTYYTNKVMATLRLTLIEFPEWWEQSDMGYELDDFIAALMIYKECQKFENEYAEKVWGEKPKEDTKKSGSEKAEEK